MTDVPCLSTDDFKLEIKVISARHGHSYYLPGTEERAFP